MANNTPATQITLAPDVEKGIKAVTKYANDAAIIDKMDMVYASAYVKQIAKLQKTIEAERITITKPLNESLKNINNFFKKFSVPLGEADAILRTKLLACKTLLPAEEGNRFGEIHFKRTTTITVTDATKVPREFLQVSEKAIEKAYKENPDIVIPGITFGEEKIVSL